LGDGIAVGLALTETGFIVGLGDGVGAVEGCSVGDFDAGLSGGSETLGRNVG